VCQLGPLLRSQSKSPFLLSQVEIAVHR
jgi:hypothetical protein